MAVAESLTAGKIAGVLGAPPAAARWFRGGVVAYSTEVKHQVLGVPDVPVVSVVSATAMARGVVALMDADIAVAVTGVGGPDAEDSELTGSVASGMVAVQLAVPAAEGLDRLRAYSYAQGRSIAAVAADIVARRLSLRGERDEAEG